MSQMLHPGQRVAATRCAASLVVALTVLTLTVHAVPVSAGTAAPSYAPLDRPGPTLDVPAATLAASLSCTSNLRSSTREPVLLVPGTTATPSANFSWNYERALSEQGMPWCAVTLPDKAMGDIQ
ncbi:MAG: hypothetical protein QOG80_2276, partial [Pseudonocardiales bacterium]|nr:hypothetical protein [Pseudonocardiales bacterium]